MLRNGQQYVATVKQRRTLWTTEKAHKTHEMAEHDVLVASENLVGGKADMWLNRK
jgi:hypothetical protein